MNTIDRLYGNEAARTYIQNAEVARTMGAQQPGKADHRPVQKADSVTLSDSARSLAVAREAVQNASDVREHKVAEIKQRVADGTYSVPSRVLARKLLSAHD
jgi:flagellar biosynthesis anti-sigma factor FlgM